MPPPNETPAPIIIVKKKGGHGGHHGGAWKVAYADFVTAMMAFFLVMWLLNAGPKVREAVSGYFNDPAGYKEQMGSGAGGSGEALQLKKDDMPLLKEKLEQALKEMPMFLELKDQVKLTVTGEGLRIELLETEKGFFFESGSAKPSDYGRELILKIAGELGKLPNTIVVEGHTDSRVFAGIGYSNWELSVDRANMARRLLQSSGLRDGQVVQVRGFADHQPFDRNNDAHPSNRRISIIVEYLKEEQKTVTSEEVPQANSQENEGEYLSY